MMKCCKRIIAIITFIAMVVTLIPTISVVKKVKAEETKVTLQPWAVYHSPKIMPDSDLGNAGVVNSFITSDGELARGLNSTVKEQTVCTTKASNGFTIDIATTGWDKERNNDTINPWSVEAEMNNIAVSPGHVYSISFKAKASKKKYAYISDRCGDIASIFEGNTDVEKFLVIGTEEKEYTIEFTNWIGATKFDFVYLLGAFNSTNDFNGTSLIAKGFTGEEVNWSGTVTVKDFEITDKGLNPDYIVSPTESPELTTKSPETTIKSPESTTKSPELTYSIDMNADELEGAYIYLDKYFVDRRDDEIHLILEPKDGTYFAIEPRVYVYGAKIIYKNMMQNNSIEYIISEFEYNTVLSIKGITQKIASQDETEEVVRETQKSIVPTTISENIKQNENLTVKSDDAVITYNQKANLKSVKPMKKSLKLLWKKSKAADGYQIQVSAKISFAKTKTINVNNGRALGVKIKGLKAKKKYYVRIRSYVVSNGTKVYSKWSKVIAKKTK